MNNNLLSWVEINKSALISNINTFREIIGSKRNLMIVVKSNAYGHGLLEVSHTVLEAGADWLAVFDIEEAIKLRENNITAPILILGQVMPTHYQTVLMHDLRITLASKDAINSLIKHQPNGLKVHIKIETGTNRQGLQLDELDHLKLLQDSGIIEIEGAYTHYADIDAHRYSESQLANYEEAINKLAKMNIVPKIKHASCTAATLLFENTLLNMARVGIGAYGLWPSKETFVSAHQSGKSAINLSPVMTWKTKVMQVKSINAGEYVGYGRTFKAMRKTCLAILPVGYSNGYDRNLSNKSHVLICGKRSPIVGRIMMNMIIADITDITNITDIANITDIQDIKTGDEVVLLGRQGDEEISAEMIAGWLSTINYEVVTRAEPFGKRILT